MRKKTNYVMAGLGKDTSINRVKYIISGEEQLNILHSKDLSSSYVSSYTVIDKINTDLYGGKEYLIDVEWKDGDKSLISIDEE
ncbi:MAG: hypothetical protein J5979_00310, partial [Lachnospiraceae bacterium]|nr:hypothetical protein [Lachnospiraceae bacterium]